MILFEEEVANNQCARYGWSRPYQGWTFLPLENNQV